MRKSLYQPKLAPQLIQQHYSSTVRLMLGHGLELEETLFEGFVLVVGRF